MAALSRPDLAPRNSPEYIGWLARYQAQQAAKQQQQQEQEVAAAAAVLAKKRRELHYNS